MTFGHPRTTYLLIHVFLKDNVTDLNHGSGRGPAKVKDKEGSFYILRSGAESLLADGDNAILGRQGVVIETHLCVSLREVGELNGKGRGTLEFTVDVDVPKKLNDEQRELLKQFAQSFGDEVNVKKKSIFDDIKSKFN